MSVLIKDMEMPRHCGECGIEWCDRWKQLIIAGMSIAKTRPSDCPLIELPPHLSEKNDFWKNEYIKEHDARVEEYKNSVPVVRCAFCEHYIKHDKRCGVWNHGVFKDDYCSRGQKKEVEE